jgi:glutamate-1-semialdehyde 2,1-aminomutase
MEGIAARLGSRGAVRGLPPCFHVSFGGPADVTDYRSWAGRDVAAHDRFWEALQDRGIRTVPEGTWFVSAAHTEEDVARTLAAVDEALRA